MPQALRTTLNYNKLNIEMNMNFNRRKIETVCILLSFSLVVLLTFLGILATADEIFNWDILPENIEKIMILLFSSIRMVIGASFVLSLMINFSIISISLELFSENFKKFVDKENE